MNGKRPKLRRILSDPSATVVPVEHRDRLASFGVEHLEAALSAQGRRIVVADPGETTDDLVRDMIEVLTSMCPRLYGRRGARNRAMRAVSPGDRRPLMAKFEVPEGWVAQAYRFALDPTPSQVGRCWSHAGRRGSPTTTCSPCEGRAWTSGRPNAPTASPRPT